MNQYMWFDMKTINLFLFHIHELRPVNAETRRHLSFRGFSLELIELPLGINLSEIKWILH